MRQTTLISREEKKELEERAKLRQIREAYFAYQNAPTSALRAISRFGKWQLAFSLLSLASSIVLLFLGTYLYHFEHHHLIFDSNSWFDSIGTLFVEIFVGDTSSSSLMMFVAAISIIFEIFLILAVLFANFAASLMLTTVMIMAFVTHAQFPATNRAIPSFMLQIVFLLSFAIFTATLRIKTASINNIICHKVNKNNNNNNINDNDNDNDNQQIISRKRSDTELALCMHIALAESRL